MTELFHDGDAGVRNRGGGPLGIFRRAGEIILAREQIKRTYPGIDRLDPAAQVAIDAIEVQIALEDARTALLVGPQRFVSRDFGPLRRDQAGHPRRAAFAAAALTTGRAARA